MESSAKIPIALDPSDMIVSIDEAYERERYYRCIECDDYLQVRHGKIRTWYFAHYSQNEDSPNCPLRTVLGIEQLMEDLRTSPIEKYEESHTLRIAIIPDNYTGIAKVVALFHNPFSELTDKREDIFSILNTLSMKGVGLLKSFDKKQFHPSEPLVKLELDPDCEEYELEFEAKQNLEALSGKWASKGISKGDIFTGNINTFEKIDNYKKISEGASFYEVVETVPEQIEKSIFKIGRKFVIEREIDEIKSKINHGEKMLNVPIKSFEVDIIEPRLSDPWGDDIIYGLPNSKALLAIRPRKGLDPEFEIVSVPKKRDSIIKIEQSGKGNIRYQWIQFPSFASYRITIHHVDSHVYLHFFVKNENFEKIDLNMDKNIVGINYISNKDKFATVYPWQNKTIYLKKSSLSKVNVFHPEEWSFDIEMEALKDVNGLPIKNSIKTTDLTSYIDISAEEGFIIFKLNFKGFGFVRIILSETPKKMDFKDISERIISLGIRPRTRVSWDLIRKICNAPPGTQHKKLQEKLTPKMVRKVLKSLREGSEAND